MAIGARWNDGGGDRSGHVRVYKNVSGTWSQIGSDIDGGGSSHLSGGSVRLSSDGNTVAVGGSRNVRIYKNESNIWTQIGNDINFVGIPNASGYIVSLSSDGGIVAISRSQVGNDTYYGIVRIFKNIEGTWTQIGNDINRKEAGDSFGSDVSLSSDGSIVAIGVSYSYIGNNDSGLVQIYKNQSGTWTQIGNDINRGNITKDYFGSSVKLSNDGSIVTIGSIKNASIYKNQLGEWKQVGNDILSLIHI